MECLTLTRRDFDGVLGAFPWKRKLNIPATVFCVSWHPDFEFWGDREIGPLWRTHLPEFEAFKGR